MSGQTPSAQELAELDAGPEEAYVEEEESLFDAVSPLGAREMDIPTRRAVEPMSWR